MKIGSGQGQARQDVDLRVALGPMAGQDSAAASVLWQDVVGKCLTTSCPNGARADGLRKWNGVLGEWPIWVDDQGH